MKAKVWAQIVDVSSKESQYVREAKIKGFYQRNQLDIIAPYFEKFYGEIVNMHHGVSHRYFMNWFNMMLPTYQIADAHIVKLASIKVNTPDSESNLSKNVQDAIEKLLRIQELKAFATSELK